MTATLAPRRHRSAPAQESGARAELWVANAGLIAYQEALGLQERLRAARHAGVIPDVLLLLEHPRVYTRGRRTEAADLPLGEDWYRAHGIEVEECDRGGRVTYHGPGQLVGYPIVATRDVLEYVRSLERALLAALGDEGVGAEVRKGFTGVWVGERKIASIGVHVQHRVTTHGFAVNVNCDLAPFEWVVPCGIGGVRMTSLARETGRAGDPRCFRKRVAWRLAEELGRRQRIMSLARLLERAGAPESVPR